MSKQNLLVCLLVVTASACRDDSSAPHTPRPTTLESVTPAIQHGIAGDPVAVGPAVRVRDAEGAPLAGVEVRFAVVAGEGSITTAQTVTDADGVGRAGDWILGEDPGVNVLEATAAELPPLRFEATGESSFHIDVRIIGSVTARQQQAIDKAVARWRSALVRDIADLSFTAPARACFDTQPALNELIDDLLLFVQFTPIDGVGKVLGQAGPCAVRAESNLPAMGYVQLDAADLEAVEAHGALDDLVLHEFGHVLGIGVIWTQRQLLSGAGTDDPTFIGVAATDAWHALGGASPGVPVENTGSSGTRESHWRESVFGSELMTGYLSSADNPLSAMTIASLADLGYRADTGAAASFSLTRPAPSAVFIDLQQRERIVRPRYRVFRDGERRTFDR